MSIKIFSSFSFLHPQFRAFHRNFLKSLISSDSSPPYIPLSPGYSLPASPSDVFKSESCHVRKNKRHPSPFAINPTSFNYRKAPNLVMLHLSIYTDLANAITPGLLQPHGVWPRTGRPREAAAASSHRHTQWGKPRQ